MRARYYISEDRSLRIPIPEHGRGYFAQVCAGDFDFPYHETNDLLFYRKYTADDIDRIKDLGWDYFTVKIEKTAEHNFWVSIRNSFCLSQSIAGKEWGELTEKERDVITGWLHADSRDYYR